MAFKAPCITDKHTVYTGDALVTNLSFAIWLIDDYTKNKPIGRIQVEIKEISRKAFRNLSGYYCFTNLEVGNYIVSINSELYFPGEIVIDSSKIYFSDVVLKFDTLGPAAGETSTKLEDVSKLQKDDIIEFRNLSCGVERKIITDINTSTRTIFWAKELKCNFNSDDSTIIALKNPVVTIRLKPLPSFPFSNNATLVRGVINDSDGHPVARACVEVKNKSIKTESDENGEFVLYFSKIENKQISIDIDVEINGNKETFNQTLEEGKTQYLRVIST